MTPYLHLSSLDWSYRDYTWHTNRDTYDKLIFDERIFINERIRDIVYVEDNNLILMAFEEKGELGILSNTRE